LRATSGALPNLNPAACKLVTDFGPMPGPIHQVVGILECTVLVTLIGYTLGSGRPDALDRGQRHFVGTIDIDISMAGLMARIDIESPSGTHAARGTHAAMQRNFREGKIERPVHQKTPFIGWLMPAAGWRRANAG
jgi:hypothetical protein